jgi:hypothetical protein
MAGSLAAAAAAAAATPAVPRNWLRLARWMNPERMARERWVVLRDGVQLRS